jgi:hypothetical protein
MHRNTIIFLVAIVFLVGIMYFLRPPAPEGGYPQEPETHTHGPNDTPHAH